jgi:nicotinamide phosphoribosyltransferase
MKLNIPIILQTDSYKGSHYRQYPQGARYVSSYIESRGTAMPWNEHVFFGLQAFIKANLLTPVTHKDVDEATALFKGHMGIFNEDGWRYIVNAHGGYLPISIEAVPEGAVLPLHNVLVQVVNTDPKCAWLTSYVETSLLRAIWYPTTVATLSREVKKLFTDFLIETTGSTDGIDFMLHDFGARGVSSSESAQIGGAAHMVNFKGSDTVEGILWAREYYGADMPAFSVPAAEHSTITSWGKEGEAEAYKNMLHQFSAPNAIISIVSDSWDIWNAISNIYGEELKKYVSALAHIGAKLVVRPDSGEPVEVVPKVIKNLLAKFGGAENSKGYMKLPDFLGVLQGDGCNYDSIGKILLAMKKDGYAANNVVFGMGGGLLQKVDRDTLKFAMKCSAIDINGEWHDVYKDPIDDPGKVSKRGRQALVYRNGALATIPVAEIGSDKNLLEEVYRNGKLLVDYTFDEVRERAAI